MKIRQTVVPEDRIFILQCLQSDLLTNPEARELLFVAEEE